MTLRVRALVLSAMVYVPACGGASSGDSGGGQHSQGTGNATSAGGASSSGGSIAAGGVAEPGGSSASGGTSAPGGATASGGTNASGGVNAVGTGGSTSGGAANTGGGVNACGKTPLSKAVGRPTIVACPESPLAENWHDAGVMTCVSATDCPGGEMCLKGMCGPDECHLDTDCSSGFACACAAGYYGGNAIHGNPCVPAQCRIDADCKTPGGTCAPSFSGRCGALSGYYCHSPADTCNTDADCCGSTPNCSYQPTLGHWACQSFTVCNG